MIDFQILYSYYHKNLIKVFKFIIPPQKNILFYGLIDGTELESLSPRIGVGIEPELVSGKKFAKNLTYNKIEYEAYISKQQFDYIVFNGTLGKSLDIMKLLNNIKKACNPHTRVVIYQHNHLWQDLLKFLEKLGLKRKEVVFNWLSISDVNNYLKASGFETTRIFRHTLLPIRLFGIGPCVNL